MTDAGTREKIRELLAPVAEPERRSRFELATWNAGMNADGNTPQLFEVPNLIAALKRELDLTVRADTHVLVLDRPYESHNFVLSLIEGRYAVVLASALDGEYTGDYEAVTADGWQHLAAMIEEYVQRTRDAYLTPHIVLAWDLEIDRELSRKNNLPRG